MRRSTIFGPCFLVVLILSATAGAHPDAVEKALRLAERAKQDRAAALEAAKLRETKLREYTAKQRAAAAEKVKREAACAGGQATAECKQATRVWVAEAQAAWTLLHEIEALDGRLVKHNADVTSAQHQLRQLPIGCGNAVTSEISDVCFDGVRNKWRASRGLDVLLEHRELVRAKKVEANTSKEAQKELPEAERPSRGGDGSECGEGGVFRGYTSDGRPICGHPADPL